MPALTASKILSVAREFRRDVEDAMTTYREVVLREAATSIESAPLPLYAAVSEDFEAGYRQCQSDMAELLEKKAGK